MKIKFDNGVSGDAHQIEILPRLSFFWEYKVYCIGFGWLIFNVEIWFGILEE